MTAADKRNRNVKIVVSLSVILLLIGVTTFLAYNKYFVKPVRRPVSGEVNYFKDPDDY